MLEANLKPQSSQIQQLTLAGRASHPHWVVWLLSALAREKVAVASAIVSRTDVATWDANFTLDFTRSRVRPEMLDYVRLASTESSLTLAPPAPTRFLMSRRADGSLELLVEAPDHPDVLGGLLHRLAGHALFPSEITLWAVRLGLRHKLVLRGISGTRPSEATEENVERALARLIRKL